MSLDSVCTRRSIFLYAPSFILYYLCIASILGQGSIHRPRPWPLFLKPHQYHLLTSHIKPQASPIRQPCRSRFLNAKCWSNVPYPTSHAMPLPHLSVSQPSPPINQSQVFLHMETPMKKPADTHPPTVDLSTSFLCATVGLIVQTGAH